MLTSKEVIELEKMFKEIVNYMQVAAVSSRVKKNATDYGIGDCEISVGVINGATKKHLFDRGFIVHECGWFWNFVKGEKTYFIEIDRTRIK